ncbi:hypothetical protein [Sphingomonas sp. UYP23]
MSYTISGGTTPALNHLIKVSCQTSSGELIEVMITVPVSSGLRPFERVALTFSV